MGIMLRRKKPKPTIRTTNEPVPTRCTGNYHLFTCSNPQSGTPYFQPEDRCECGAITYGESVSGKKRRRNIGGPK